MTHPAARSDVPIAAPQSARRLVINADDFGLTAGVNEGIVLAHLAGVVTSTSLMVTAGAAVDASRRSQEHPSLGVGLHFVTPEDSDPDDPPTLRAALEGQLDWFERLIGRQPTHLDSHHHVHLDGERMTPFREIAARLDVPLRGTGTIDYIGGFYAQWIPGESDPAHVSVEHLCSLIADEALSSSTELACHPAANLVGLRSSYAEDRLLELRTLLAPGLLARIVGLGVELVNFTHARPPKRQ